MNYKDTLNLPETEFPMKAQLPKREPIIGKKWEEIGLVEKLASRDRPWFVLHDGPPYSNGHIHLGQALNKILKDMINKFKALKGFRVHFVPGWDTHGMPIENEVTKHDPEFAKMSSSARTTAEPSVRLRIREKCRVFALHWVDVQKEEFKRLGVIGDWDRPYLTIRKEYEAQELNILAHLTEQGYIYRGHMPIHWCPTCGTALAMVEIDYKEISSPSLWFLAEVSSDPDGLFPQARAYALVWTTTPWTLLANRAFAFGSDVDYIALETSKGLVVLAEGLRDSVAQVWPELAQARLVKRFKGREAENLVFRHPLFPDKSSRAVLAAHVSLDAGSGIVHIAPGHGREDFEVGQKYGLEVFSPVDEAGKFTQEADEQTDHPLHVRGLSTKQGGDKAVQRLEQQGLLVHIGQIDHQYPHCWRCKNPLIFRATSQWFLSVDHNGLRTKAVSDIPSVKWHPESSQAKITASVAERPDWCISRQRQWGVFIPAVYCENCGTEVLDPKIIRNVARITREEGSDAWITDPIEKFLPEGFKCPKCGGTHFRKEQDILDVWFDSGVTSTVVLPEYGMPLPADIYLEGPDQHRGWFNASLMIAEATIGKPPYKAVITHGWVLDEKGYTMHKSLGNAISPSEIIDKFGADVLRLWVASTDYTQDVRLGKEILARTVDAYRKIRNSFRYCLGNLYDFVPETHALEPEDMLALDRYILHRLRELTLQVERAWENLEFHKATRLINGFITTELSAMYMDAVKDRLYTRAPASVQRRSAQTVLWHTAGILSKLLSPVLSYTCEEVYQLMPGAEKQSVFLEDWPTPPERWNNPELAEEFNVLLSMVETANKALERARVEAKIIKNSLQARVLIHLKTGHGREVLLKHKDQLAEILVVSGLEIVDSPKGGVQEETESWVIGVDKALGQKCVRCWMWSDEIGADRQFPDVCPKCAQALREIKGDKSQH